MELSVSEPSSPKHDSIKEDYRGQFRVRDCILIRVTEEKLLHYMNQRKLHTVERLGPEFGYSSPRELERFELILKEVCKKKLTYKAKRHSVELNPAYAKQVQTLKRRRLH